MIKIHVFPSLLVYAVASLATGISSIVCNSFANPDTVHFIPVHAQGLQLALATHVSALVSSSDLAKVLTIYLGVLLHGSRL
jgi:hypothetical protein